MKKWYTLSVNSCGLVDTYDDAVKEAKRMAKDERYDVYIFETVALAQSPIPDVEIVKL